MDFKGLSLAVPLGGAEGQSQAVIWGRAPQVLSLPFRASTEPRWVTYGPGERFPKLHHSPSA